MRNRRQTNPGPGGAPREGSVAQRDGFPTDVAIAHDCGARVNDIGRAGRTGHISS